MTQVARVFLALALLAGVPAAARAQSAPASPAPAAAAPAAPAPDATPTPLPQSDAVDKRAKSEFLAWQSGKLDKSNYTKRLADEATDMAISQISPQLQALGDFKSITWTSAWMYQGYKNYQYVVACSKGSMLMIVALDPQGLTGGVRFRPVPAPQ